MSFSAKGLFKYTIAYRILGILILFFMNGVLKRRKKSLASVFSLTLNFFFTESISSLLD